VTVDPTTGLTTRVGNTGINIAGIAFAGTGALYGVTGDAANGGPLTNGIPASLYTLDTTTGAPTFMKALGTSVASCTTGNGEAIGFNIDDGLIYHVSGTGACQVFETIDPTTLTQTNIALSGDVLPEVLTIVHWSGNLFLISTSDDLYILSKNGQARHLSNDGATGSFYKGLVFGGTPPACPPLGALYGAANIGPDGPSVLYSINPATAAATMIGPIGFERVSGIAFNSAQTLYGTGERQDGSNTHVLMTINPCTGAGTEVGPTLISSDGFATATDISVRGSDGTLFAFLSGKTADALATLNTSTGAHTIIASYQINSGGGLAFSPSSVLFNAYGTNLEALDPTTGTVTTVVPFGFPALFLPGNSAVNAMDFQPVTGNFFGSVVTATAAGVGNFLVTIDPIAAGAPASLTPSLRCCKPP
jgi:hypothetical protein